MWENVVPHMSEQKTYFRAKTNVRNNVMPRLIKNTHLIKNIRLTKKNMMYTENFTFQTNSLLGPQKSVIEWSLMVNRNS